MADAVYFNVAPNFDLHMFAGQLAEKYRMEGFTVTVHGKGTYVAATNTERLLEEQKKEVEADLEKAIQKARRCGISDEDLKDIFELLLEG